jgi:hypothetical protein
VFARAWKLLTANWPIIVPGLVVGALGGSLSAILAPRETASDLAAWIGALAIGAVEIVATIISIAYTTGMAQAAWERGKATYADGFKAFSREGGHVFVAMIGLSVLGILSLLLFELLPFTFGISLALWFFFFIYTMPAAVVGERPGLLAMRDSFTIAVRRPIPTVLMLLALTAIIAIMGVVAGLLAATPYIGPLVAALVVQVAIAYLTLVTVGEYMALRRVLHT